MFSNMVEMSHLVATACFRWRVTPELLHAELARFRHTPRARYTQVCKILMTICTEIITAESIIQLDNISTFPIHAAHLCHSCFQCTHNSRNTHHYSRNHSDKVAHLKEEGPAVT